MRLPRAWTLHVILWTMLGVGPLSLLDIEKMFCQETALLDQVRQRRYADCTR